MKKENKIILRGVDPSLLEPSTASEDGSAERGGCAHSGRG